MNDELLKRLSDADSIASCEDEVRNILYHELKDYCDEVYCDSLGSNGIKLSGQMPKTSLILKSERSFYFSH